MATNTRRATPASSHTAAWFARGFWLVLGLALVVRVMVFPFAENKHGDAPVRALIAERMNADARAAADPRTFCQFGPLPIEVMRPFLLLDTDARRSSRWPSLLAGLALFFPFWAYSRRLAPGAPTAVLAAGIALAVSPLHIQVSTTAASEALYLLVLVAMLERLHAAVSTRGRGAIIAAGAFASLAAVTRFDSWLAIPAAAAAMVLFGPRDRRAFVDVALFLGLAAVAPLAYLGWLTVVGGSPFFFLRYINGDHATLGQAMVDRYGPWLARLRQIALWLAALAATLTPALLLAAFAPWRGFFRMPVATRVVLCAGLAPLGVYLLKGLGLGQFEPLPRFALVPGLVVLPLAARALVDFTAARRHGRVGIGRPALLIVVGAVVVASVTSALAFGRSGRVWAGAESMGPITRLDPDERQLAAFLLRHRRPEEGVFIDPLDFADINIAHAARIPMALVASLARTRHPRPSLAAMRAATDASWFAAHDSGWGAVPIAGWPTDSDRFGHWRVTRWRPPSSVAPAAPANPIPAARP